jgi:hypothetical protein
VQLSKKWITGLIAQVTAPPDDGSGGQASKGQDGGRRTAIAAKKHVICSGSIQPILDGFIGTD